MAFFANLPKGPTTRHDRRPVEVVQRRCQYPAHWTLSFTMSTSHRLVFLFTVNGTSFLARLTNHRTSPLLGPCHPSLAWRPVSAWRSIGYCSTYLRYQMRDNFRLRPWSQRSPPKMRQSNTFFFKFSWCRDNMQSAQAFTGTRMPTVSGLEISSAGSAVVWSLCLRCPNYRHRILFWIFHNTSKE